MQQLGHIIDLNSLQIHFRMHQESTFSATRAHSLPLGLVRPVIGTTGQTGVWTPLISISQRSALRRVCFQKSGAFRFKRRGCCGEPRMRTQNRTESNEDPSSVSGA
jgi:hypothetical protein